MLITLSASGSLIKRTWREFLRTSLRYCLLSVRGFIISTSSLPTAIFSVSCRREKQSFWLYRYPQVKWPRPRLVARVSCAIVLWLSQAVAAERWFHGLDCFPRHSEVADICFLNKYVTNFTYLRYCFVILGINSLHAKELVIDLVWPKRRY